MNKSNTIIINAYKPIPEKRENLISNINYLCVCSLNRLHLYRNPNIFVYK